MQIDGYDLAGVIRQLVSAADMLLPPANRFTKQSPS
jgi:hypothetical protein